MKSDIKKCAQDNYRVFSYFPDPNTSWGGQDLDNTIKILFTLTVRETITTSQSQALENNLLSGLSWCGYEYAF
jgi:hypothetical protein